MNKIPITIATISQYTIPETILFEIPLLNCPKESAPVTNSRNRFMIPLPIVPKKVIQSLRKTGESCEQCSCYAVPCQQEHKAFIRLATGGWLDLTRQAFHLLDYSPLSGRTIPICTSNRFLYSIIASIIPPSVFRTRYS